MLLGNMILGIGAALLAYSLMGNEPYTAMNMAISGGISMGLGLADQPSWCGNYCGSILLRTANYFFNKYNRKWIVK